MKNVSILSYFRKMTTRILVVLIAGSLAYLLASVYFQYNEKKAYIKTQANHVVNAIRNDFVNGNLTYLYEQCRSLSSQDNVKKIVIQKTNYVFCNEEVNGSSWLVIATTIPIKFNPEIDDSDLTNIAGSLTLGIDGRDMFYSFLMSALFLATIVFGILILIRRAHNEIESKIVTPIATLTQAIALNGSRDLSKFDSNITELKQLYDSYHSSLENAKIAEELKIESSKNEAIVHVTKQVAHDIRSPVSVLNMLIPSLQMDCTQEKCDLILQATQRIDAIAEDLLKRGSIVNKTEVETLSVEDVSKIISEKKALLNNNKVNARIEFTHSVDKLFKSKINKLDFERIVSNLLNNSIEALDHSNNGLIELGLTDLEGATVLVVSDNGKGIPKEMLSKIGIQGFTTGKKNGNGLGVFHAKSKIEDAGGRFKIDSAVGQGTTVTITI